MRSLVILGVLLTGCGASQASPAFSAAAVRQSLQQECESPIVVDETFCEQVEISGITASGDTLVVPTTLNAAATARAGAICETLGLVHFDADGNDLGYASITVNDQDGAEAASCSV